MTRLLKRKPEPNSNPPVVYKDKTYQKYHFMHINKTAGHTCHDWLNMTHDIIFEPGGDAGAHTIVDKFKDDVFYFTIVRNPYDRLASHYFQWRRNGTFNKKRISTRSDPEYHIESPDHMIKLLIEGKVPFSNGLAKKKTNSIFCLEDFGAFEYETNNFLTYKKYKMMMAVDEDYRDLIFLLPCSEWIRDPQRFKIFKKEKLHLLEKFFTSGELKPNIKKHVPLTKDLRNENTRTKQLDSYKHLFSEESIEFIKKAYHNDFEIYRYQK